MERPVSQSGKGPRSNLSWTATPAGYAGFRAHGVWQGTLRRMLKTVCQFVGRTTSSRVSRVGLTLGKARATIKQY